MADSSSSASSEVTAAILHSMVDSFTSGAAAAKDKRSKVHGLLGGGKPADVLLWKDKHISMALLVGSTVAWFLFEWSGYTLLTLLSNVLLFLVVILFLWATVASSFNRQPPPIPEILLTEEMVSNLASTLRVEINKVLVAAHDVAIGKDFRVFIKVVAALWVLSKLGAWFNFITLVYIVVVAAHTLPIFYDKYQDEIEQIFKKMWNEAKKQYSKVDATVLSKIPRAGAQKKSH